MFLCGAAISVCGLATMGTGTFGFPNGWLLPFQENPSEVIKGAEEEAER